MGSGTSYVNYGRNWASASSTPFDRHKFTAFEGGTHVPAFVHYPREVQAGSRSESTATVMDLLPTFLALADSEHPGTPYRGRDVIPPVERRWQLFNLENDPFEQNDISADFPQKYAEMLTSREQYAAESGGIY